MVHFHPAPSLEVELPQPDLDDITCNNNVGQCTLEYAQVQEYTFIRVNVFLLRVLWELFVNPQKLKLYIMAMSVLDMAMWS